MSGMLIRRACWSGSNALVDQLTTASDVALAQASRWERCFSGACASTSGTGMGSALGLAAHLAGAIKRHTFAAATTAGGLAAPSCIAASGVAPALGAAASTPAPRGLRGFAAAASEAAVAPSKAASAPSSPGDTAVRLPWPWVDPSRPQVLPVAAVRPCRATLPLDAALDRLLAGLRPGQVPRHSLEVFVRFQLDPRRSDHLVRGSVVLPYGMGKKVRIVVFAKGADAEEARREGVDMIGDEELISTIIASEPGADLGFDRLIATPEFMRPLARAGRVLGPKGLMPNPKMGTLTTDVMRAVSEIRRGRLDYRLGRDSAVRAAVGRTSMSHAQLSAHVGGLVASMLDNKPKTLGGPPVASSGGGTEAGGGSGGDKGAAAGAGAPAGAAALAAGMAGYVQTFLLKTTRSAPIAVTFDSLAEAAVRYRALAGAGALEAAAQGSGPAQGSVAGASDKVEKQ